MTCGLDEGGATDCAAVISSVVFEIPSSPVHGTPISSPFFVRFTGVFLAPSTSLPAGILLREKTGNDDDINKKQSSPLRRIAWSKTNVQGCFLLRQTP